MTREGAGAERLEAGGGVRELRCVVPRAEREPRRPLDPVRNEPGGQLLRRPVGAHVTP